MKRFLTFLPGILIAFLLATVLPADDAYGQKTGVYGYATRVTSSSAVSYLTFDDTTSTAWKLPNGSYNPNFKKTRQVPKPVVFEHDGYHGMVTIRNKNNYNEIYWRGPINYLKVGNMTTGPGALRDSTQIAYLKIHTMNAVPLLALLLLRFSRRKGRKEYGSNPGDHSKTS